MSEFTVCRTLDTHPALRYCLLLDDDRIAGGKPDYRGNNILISWRTKETYGPVDDLLAENAKLRELSGEVASILFNLDVDRCGLCQRDSISHPCPVHTVKGGECLIKSELRELGIEVGV